MRYTITCPVCEQETMAVFAHDCDDIEVVSSCPICGCDDAILHANKYALEDALEQMRDESARAARERREYAEERGRRVWPTSFLLR